MHQKKSWGAVCRGRNIAGQWSLQESGLHFNILELKAVYLATLAFAKMMSLALAYLVNMGGTQNVQLIQLAKDMWTFLLSKGVTITAEHLPGKLNVKADWMSRNFRDFSEWLLAPWVFQILCKRWGTPDVDLFASRLFHQVPSYVLETGSGMLGSGCTTTTLGKSLPLCISSVFANREGVSEGQAGQSMHDFR